MGLLTVEIMICVYVFNKCNRNKVGSLCLVYMYMTAKQGQLYLLKFTQFLSNLEKQSTCSSLQAETLMSRVCKFWK